MSQTTAKHDLSDALKTRRELLTKLEKLASKLSLPSPSQPADATQVLPHILHPEHQFPQCPDGLQSTIFFPPNPFADYSPQVESGDHIAGSTTNATHSLVCARTHVFQDQTLHVWDSALLSGILDRERQRLPEQPEEKDLFTQSQKISPSESIQKRGYILGRLQTAYQVAYNTLNARDFIDNPPPLNLSVLGTLDWDRIEQGSVGDCGFCTPIQLMAFAESLIKHTNLPEDYPLFPGRPPTFRHPIFSSEQLAQLQKSPLFRDQYQEPQTSLFKDMFLPQAPDGSGPVISPTGHYFLRFFFNGCYRAVSIDDRIFYRNLKPYEWNLTDGLGVLRVQDKPEVWATLLEKAGLQLSGLSYACSYNEDEALNILGGFVPDIHFLCPIDLPDGTLESPGQYKKRIHRLFIEIQAGYKEALCVATTGTFRCESEKSPRDGIYDQHSYMIVAVRCIQVDNRDNPDKLRLLIDPDLSEEFLTEDSRMTDEKGHEILYLLRLRNPHHRTRSTLPFSPSDKKRWTPTLQAVCQYDREEDEHTDRGEFWVELQDWMKRSCILNLAWIASRALPFSVRSHFCWHVPTRTPAQTVSSSLALHSLYAPQWLLHKKRGQKVLVHLVRHVSHFGPSENRKPDFTSLSRPAGLDSVEVLCAPHPLLTRTEAAAFRKKSTSTEERRLWIRDPSEHARRHRFSAGSVSSSPAPRPPYHTRVGWLDDPEVHCSSKYALVVRLPDEDEGYYSIIPFIRPNCEPPPKDKDSMEDADCTMTVYSTGIIELSPVLPLSQTNSFQVVTLPHPFAHPFTYPKPHLDVAVRTATPLATPAPPSAPVPAPPTEEMENSLCRMLQQHTPGDVLQLALQLCMGLFATQLHVEVAMPPEVYTRLQTEAAAACAEFGAARPPVGPLGTGVLAHELPSLKVFVEQQNCTLQLELCSTTLERPPRLSSLPSPSPNWLPPAAPGQLDFLGRLSSSLRRDAQTDCWRKAKQKDFVEEVIPFDFELQRPPRLTRSVSRSPSASLLEKHSFRSSLSGSPPPTPAIRAAQDLLQQAVSHRTDAEAALELAESRLKAAQKEVQAHPSEAATAEANAAEAEHREAKARVEETRKRLDDAILALNQAASDAWAEAKGLMQKEESEDEPPRRSLSPPPGQSKAAAAASDSAGAGEAAALHYRLVLPLAPEQAHNTASFRLTLSVPAGCTATVARVPELSYGANFQLNWVGFCAPSVHLHPTLMYFILQNRSAAATRAVVQSIVTMKHAGPITFSFLRASPISSVAAWAGLADTSPSALYSEDADKQAGIHKQILDRIAQLVNSIAQSPPRLQPSCLSFTARACPWEMVGQLLHPNENNKTRMAAAANEGSSGAVCHSLLQELPYSYGPIQVPNPDVFYTCPEIHVQLEPHEAMVCELAVDSADFSFNFVNMVFSDKVPIVVTSFV